MAERPPIAIVAAAGRFPGSNADLDRFWSNVAGAVDCSRDVPEGRWRLDPKQCVVSGGPTPDAVYSSRGYYLDPFEVDLTGLAVDADFVNELDPLFHLVLDVGGRAWRNAKTSRVDRRKVGVILGNICLPTDKSNDLCRDVLGGRIADAAGLPRERTHAHPLNRYAAGLPAGLLAKALGLGLGAFTLDAACASSLYALKLAADELIAGRADAMIAGGCSRPDALYTQMGFSQLRALSPSGRCSPFDARADGLVVGEGAGLFVLKRLDDAITADDSILAVFAGAGLSNDMSGNLLAPAVEGQVRAMRAAYASARWNPFDVDLVECHATGTPVGDAVEFDSLREFWGTTGKPGGCVIGSVKSTVGHLLTGAGSAAVLKVIRAMAAKTLPPQANFTSPGNNLKYAGSPFRVLNTSEAWPEPKDHPRRSAVSGFGFGGVNAHLLFEEWTGARLSKSVSVAVTPPGGTVPPDDSPVAVVGLSAHFGAWESLRDFQERVLGGGIDHPARPKRTGWDLVDAARIPGHYVEELVVPIDRFRIPPKEIEEMLPQQAAALVLAAAALDDVRNLDGSDPVVPKARTSDPRTGVFLGVTLDPNTTNFHLRWATKAVAPHLADTAGPLLTADRTMGALASCAASRIAKSFQFGGPAFTVSSEGTSAGRALELAVRALRRGDLDRAIVAGVDFAGDPRAVAATSGVHGVSDDGCTKPLANSSNGVVPGEGGAAVIVKRLADAVRDGDRVYAVIRGVGSAVGGPATGSGPDAAAYASSLVRSLSEAATTPASIDYFELAAMGHNVADGPECDAIATLAGVADRPFPVTLGAVAGTVGHAGAASFLAGFVKACLAVYHEILPPSPVETDRAAANLLAASRIQFPTSPQYWLTDKVGVRRAVVAGVSVDGTACHAVIEEDPRNAPHTAEPRAVLERRQPLGPRPEAVFAIEYDSPEEWRTRSNELLELSTAHASLERLARVWHMRRPSDPTKRRALTLVSHGLDDLRDLLTTAQSILAAKADTLLPDPARPDPRLVLRDRLFHSPNPLGRTGKLGFVYPGSGNHYAGMGRELSVQWPDILRRQQAENLMLRGQYAPDRFWTDAIPSDTSARQFLFGQVTLGTLTSDLLQSFGIKPDAMIGLSLGESAGLFGTRIWRSRDEMFRRIRESSLFGSDLGPPYRAARKQYNLPDSVPVDWMIAVVTAPAGEVRARCRAGKRAYVLIANTPAECVVGGLRADVSELLAQYDGRYVVLSGVTIAHCEAGLPVEDAYRKLHRLPTTHTPGLKVYSGAWARAYLPSEAMAADSITAGLTNPIDFPAVIDMAYREGVRLFIEVGPGGSCTRMIDAILENRPHLARAATSPRQNDVSLVLRLVAHLIAERVPVDLGVLYGQETLCPAHLDRAPSSRPVTMLPVGLVGTPIPIVLPSESREPHGRRDAVGSHTSIDLATFPQPPIDWHAHDSAVGLTAAAAAQFPKTIEDDPESALSMPWEQPVHSAADTPSFLEAEQPTSHEDIVDIIGPVPTPTSATTNKMSVEPILAVMESTGSPLFSPATTRDVTLRMQSNAPSSAMSKQSDLIRRLMGYDDEDGDELPAPAPAPTNVPRSLNTEQCFAFARGRIGDVLGSTYAAIDAHPTRVRLPDAELMLVDNIRLIEGEPRSMTSGRVVTDHTVHPQRWYLDGGVCPTSVTVESGQADLFLSGFLGIDFETKGLAVYRLLDAVVTFHRGLPRVGETIVYDIRIDEFFRQADSWLFRFHFEGTINGRPMLSMRNGVAGFFTQAALDAGRGIVHTKLDLMPLPGKRPDDWSDLCPLAACSLDARGVDALRRGHLVPAFGNAFATVNLHQPMKLPGGKLRLVDRVPLIDPHGGRFGIGFIRAEYDIDPKDWFLVCHFVDDRVMPGTLMYECCLHTLRILLMRIGWVGEEGDVVCEPVPGMDSRLKCRGQVLDTTKRVTYEVSVKELGYGPEPFCIADALMYADGKPIVEITNMSLRMSGLTREKLEGIWASREREQPEKAPPPVTHAPGSQNRTQYDSASILAFSNGKPSEAFGEPYRVFDQDRVIARLPGPPYQFLDRVTSVTGEPFVLKAGASCVTEYAVPADAWYFEANRCKRMPFSILLEIALQPCGWLAAYCGSALTSESDLSFRNLGGKGTQFAAVGPDAGTLTVHVTMTNVSNSAGMIIQHYSMLVSNRAGKVYEGTTYFGFFGKAALANQVGMPNAKVPLPTMEEKARSFSGVLPSDPPFPGKMLRMVDRIETFVADGGKAGLGLVVGTIDVDPSFWFFEAHFYQDPVWPGSLGLESFLQLLKYVAWKRWNGSPASGWQAVALNRPHEWTYRGQIVPKDHEVRVVLEVTAADDVRKTLTANGFLMVDGRIIYQMTDFTLE
jgi:acyl transferase domain-containing protein/3-hydroxymyristoyl/3-hydroxydecanoyl-(acyl carrier protein) dehydratase